MSDGIVIGDQANTEPDLLQGVYLGDMLTEPCKRAQERMVKRHWDLPGKTISAAMSGNYDTNLLRFTDGTWAILQGEDIRDFMMNGEAVNAMFLGIISEDEYAAEMNAQADAMTGDSGNE